MSLDPGKYEVVNSPDGPMVFQADRFLILPPVHRYTQRWTYSYREGVKVGPLEPYQRPEWARSFDWGRGFDYAKLCDQLAEGHHE